MTPESELPNWNKWLDKWFKWLIVIGILVNVSGVFVTILEPDGALYAGIAKTIALSGDYINLKVEGLDWLDKPHFPFWVAAISFKIFGINTFAYKFPALLFWAIGACYTYLLARALYQENIAKLSVLIYLTAAHLVISNNDIRAEPYLTGLIVASVYHFYRSFQTRTIFNIITGSLFAAMAVMTKGPFVLLIIASGFIVDFTLKKDWKHLFNYRWWVAAFFIALFVLPEIYCLYQQFDIHPEKIVFGHTHVSGIRFFFWDSQFGRFLNNGPIRGSGDPLFFIHTTLWAFLPWSVLLFISCFQAIRYLKNKTISQEVLVLGTSVITFLLFSLSRFQLPHYMNIVFPFFAILTARYLFNLQNQRSVKLWNRIQNIISTILILISILISIYYRVPKSIVVVIAITLSSAIIFLLFGKRNVPSIVGRSFLASALVYVFLNIVFYPDLLRYQSGSNAAAFINQQEPGETTGTYLENSYSFAFYLNQPVHYFETTEAIKTASLKHSIVMFTSEDNVRDLPGRGLSVKVLKVFPHFHISQLTGTFLNYKTRDSVIKNMVVASVSNPK